MLANACVSPEGVCEVEMAVALEDEPQPGNVALRIVDRRGQTAVENHVVVDLNPKQAKSIWSERRREDENGHESHGWLSKDSLRTLMFRD